MPDRDERPEPGEHASEEEPGSSRPPTDEDDADDAAGEDADDRADEVDDEADEADEADDQDGDDDDDDERPPKPVVPDEHLGQSIVVASWVGTAAYTVVAVVDLVSVSTFLVPVMVVSGVLFLVGLLAFMAAYAIAVSRSREVLIGMGGLYFLSGSAPARVRRHLMASFGVQVGVATITASLGVARVAADAANPLAFGFLVPMYGLGLAGLWGARHGVFAPRTDLGPRATD